MRSEIYSEHVQKVKAAILKNEQDIDLHQIQLSFIEYLRSEQALDFKEYLGLVKAVFDELEIDWKIWAPKIAENLEKAMRYEFMQADLIYQLRIHVAGQLGTAFKDFLRDESWRDHMSKAGITPVELAELLEIALDQEMPAIFDMAAREETRQKNST